MIRQRENNYTQLYLGPPTADKQLQAKSVRDRSIRAYNLEPPQVYHFTNIQSRPPLSSHMPLTKHKKPIHHIPEARGYTRHVRGSALYNQQVQRQIQELAKLVSWFSVQKYLSVL